MRDVRSTSTCDHLQPPSVNQLRGSWGRHVRHARLLPPEASERACINACINDRLQSMQGTYINLSTRESMEYRRLRFLRIKPRRRRFQRSLRETSLPLTVSPSPDRSCDSTFTPAASLCALSESTSKNLAHSHLLPQDRLAHQTLPIEQPLPKGNRCASKNTRKKDPPLHSPGNPSEPHYTNQTVPSHSDVQNMCWSSLDPTPAKTAE